MISPSPHRAEAPRPGSVSGSRQWTDVRMIEITCKKDSLILRIINDNIDCAAKASFESVSITERAATLGGGARVYAELMMIAQSSTCGFASDI